MRGPSEAQNLLKKRCRQPPASAQISQRTDSNPAPATMKTQRKLSFFVVRIATVATRSKIDDQTLAAESGIRSHLSRVFGRYERVLRSEVAWESRFTGCRESQTVAPDGNRLATVASSVLVPRIRSPTGLSRNREHGYFCLRRGLCRGEHFAPHNASRALDVGAPPVSSAGSDELSPRHRRP